MFGNVLQRFVNARPIAVMARVVLMNQFSEQRIDEIFGEGADTQDTRALCFSTATRLLLEVLMQGQPSFKAVFQRDREELPTSIVSVSAKLKRAEPAVCEAPLARVADSLAEVLAEWQVLRPEPIPGYRLRIVDGNVLAGTKHRLKVLRGTRAAAPPGLTLAI